MITQAMVDVLNERCRQQTAEGWTPEHDDEHEQDEALAQAAACYARASDNRAPQPAAWPWEAQAWEPKDRRRNLVRAAALLVAEIERLDRQQSRPAFAGELAPDAG